MECNLSAVKLHSLQLKPLNLIAGKKGERELMIDLAKQFNSLPEMYPFFDFFSRIISSPSYFKGLLQCYSQKEGYSLDYFYSAFPKDIDTAEEAVFEDSIRFLVAYGINNDHEVIVRYDMVYDYLRQFTMLYLKDHPHDEPEITPLLDAVKKALLTQSA